MFGIGPMEVLIIAGIALLVFGKKLPTIMRSIGEGVSELRKGIEE